MTGYSRASDETHYQKDTRPWHDLGEGGVKLPRVELWDGGKCVKCRGLRMTNAEKVRLVQEDKVVCWGMCEVKRILVKTNTEKVRKKMERVRSVQEDGTKARVAKSLTTRK